MKIEFKSLVKIILQYKNVRYISTKIRYIKRISLLKYILFSDKLKTEKLFYKTILYEKFSIQIFYNNNNLLSRIKNCVLRH